MSIIERVALALICLGIVSGCSQRQPSPPAAAPAPASQSNAEPDPMPDATTDPQDVVKAEASPGGVPTTYAAYFEAGQLKRITETRNPGGAGSAHGEYVFYGARLTQYRGAALTSSGSNIQLNFDMQGGLTSSSAGSGSSISNEETGAIRNRAHTLRSMALARRSTQGHGR